MDLTYKEINRKFWNKNFSYDALFLHKKNIYIKNKKNKKKLIFFEIQIISKRIDQSDNDETTLTILAHTKYKPIYISIDYLITVSLSKFPQFVNKRNIRIIIENLFFAHTYIQ